MSQDTTNRQLHHQVYRNWDRGCLGCFSCVIKTILHRLPCHQSMYMFHF